jgi:two-component system chemotaxis response regulator CheB
MYQGEFDLIVMGASAGGVEALIKVLSVLPNNFSIPVVVVLHLPADSSVSSASVLESHVKLKIKEAEDGEGIEKGVIYIAPPGYHLLIERDFSFSLSLDEPVNYSRPSIDVLFESAADAYRSRVVGVILTGANPDGAVGLKAIREQNGFVIVQDPASAHIPTMPQAAMDMANPNLVLELKDIGCFLAGLS